MDDKLRATEESQAEELRRASEAFLAQQMEEMQSLIEEQRNAGMLLDDGAPLKLSVGPVKPKVEPMEIAKTKVALGGDEEEEVTKKRRALPVKLDFSMLNDEQKMKERLQEIRAALPKESAPLFKARVRWDALDDVRQNIHHSVLLIFMAESH